ncbi:helix-turn-helix domain-containing protein [Micromonospora sp. NPDC000089]|uniref:helix-turn-helix domain-containing protein n=1 Tax=unclassified Micromonospora TaxID=2617518 RepID=UPI0036B315D9
MTEEEPSTIRLTDPRAMRALAHPTRLRLLGELRARGPQTVGTLSDRLEEAVGSVSFHLGKLAEHGFVVEAPELARNRRERWWRAAHERTSWGPVQALDDPERRVASDLLRRAILERYVERLQTYFELEGTLGPEWVRGTGSSDSWLHLTSDELVEMRADLEALSARWRARSDPDRAGAETVTLMYFAFRDPR